MYEGENRRGWHVKKEITLGDLIALLVAIAAVLAAYARMDVRVSLVEQAVAYRTQSLEEIKSQLQRLDAKVERLIERR